mmetsp:Transcript_19921/g.48916  ORF Transcript_19921/g.48916 Transcript_19921/m.48916 type:complete len:88 (-) Transcript_19921:41-304(-)
MISRWHDQTSWMASWLAFKGRQHLDQMKETKRSVVVNSSELDLSPQVNTMNRRMNLPFLDFTLVLSIQKRILMSLLAESSRQVRNCR